MTAQTKSGGPLNIKRKNRGEKGKKKKKEEEIEKKMGKTKKNLLSKWAWALGIY